MSGHGGIGQSDILRTEFEFECIREFSHSGVQLGAGVSREERRERIRIAIMRENKQHRRWRDTSSTYAAMYQQVYGKALDTRQPEEQQVAPLSAMRTQLWGSDPFAEDSELDQVTEDDSF